MDNPLAAPPALPPPALPSRVHNGWMDASQTPLLHYISLLRGTLSKAPLCHTLLPLPLSQAPEPVPLQPTPPFPGQLESLSMVTGFHPRPFLILLPSCQFNLSQAKLDLISSQHRKLVAPCCLLKKDQPLWRGIPVSPHAPWNLLSWPRLSASLGLGC